MCGNLVVAFWHDSAETLVRGVMYCALGLFYLAIVGAMLVSVPVFHAMLDKVDAFHPYALWTFPVLLYFFRANLGWAMILSCAWFYYHHGRTVRPVWSVLAAGVLLMLAPSWFEPFKGYSCSYMALGIVWVVLAWKLATKQRPDWWRPAWEAGKRAMTCDVRTLAENAERWALQLKARVEPYWEQCRPAIERAKEAAGRRYEEWNRRTVVVAPPPQAPVREPKRNIPQESASSQGDVLASSEPNDEAPPESAIPEGSSSRSLRAPSTSAKPKQKRPDQPASTIVTRATLRKKGNRDC
jgi:hypothetical protein